ncbi:YjgF-like protein [Dendrothele bispora CBS 962.96]|uniref:YjgF-like protein n=1 Tax=Dendrothele bispora (strain CBS 962.96) TaxID=1314807 RepID=A0A4S8LPV5_DENBC|nr:YjgF-like protein [Dendrothele bispora CBS 962.96]
MPHTVEAHSCRYYKTESPWEKNLGFSRAVRKGPFIQVAGTTSVHPETGEMMHHESAYEQTKLILETIIKSVEGLGGQKTDITRLRLYATTKECGHEAVKAYKETFPDDFAPAAIMILGVHFAGEHMKIEVEADAIVL